MAVDLKQAFSQEHLKEAATLYGISPDQLKKHGGFENLIYSYPQGGLIFRFVHNSHRSRELVESELDWVRYLASKGLRVAKPMPSTKGTFLETVGTGEGIFNVSAFEKAPGEHVNATHKAWNDALFEEWGRFTSLMHALTRNYVPKPGIIRRLPEQGLPPKEAGLSCEDFLQATPSTPKQYVFRRHAEFVKQIDSLPKGNDVYGLCHTDLHQGNFFVQDDKITAFDFDDSAYDYFIGDVAITLIYASNFPTWQNPEADPEKQAASATRLLEPFLRGYEKHYHLDDYWINQLPVFLKRRQTLLYLITYNEEPTTPAWRTWANNTFNSVVNDTPCIWL